MISFWWREKKHSTLVNDQTLFKFTMFKEILKWPNFDQEKKSIVLCSNIKYYRNPSSSDKFQIDIILMKRKRTYDIGQWSNIIKIHHDERNSKTISLPKREKEHRALANDQILFKFTIFKEILKWSHFHEQKTNIASCSITKHSSNSSWW